MNIFSKAIWKLKVYRRHERLIDFHIATWRKHAERVHEALHPAVYGIKEERVTVELAEHVTDDANYSAGSCYDGAERCQSFEQLGMEIASAPLHYSALFCDGDTIFGYLAHLLCLQELKNGNKIFRSLVIKDPIRDKICVIKRIKSNVINLVTVIHTTVDKFFQPHNR